MTWRIEDSIAEKWPDLTFWNSLYWERIQEQLNGQVICPARKDLFTALDLCPFNHTRVAIIGQDPYPSRQYATGVAFSIPAEIKPKDFPPTLRNLLSEYAKDLHYPYPASGCLRAWCNRGVLLWNAIPSCQAGVSLSHRGLEWHHLTTEIVRLLSDRATVFVFLGGVAREYVRFVQPPAIALEYSHPIPRASQKSNKPFTGCRMFSTVNAKLKELGKQPINWRL